MSEKELRKQEPKTIKQSTVIISVGVFVAIIASFISGWFVHVHYNGQVQAEASSMVTKLSKPQK